MAMSYEAREGEVVMMKLHGSEVGKMGERKDYRSGCARWTVKILLPRGERGFRPRTR